MDNEDLAHRSVRFQDAQAMCHQGQFGQRRDAAVIAQMARSTFTHRTAGRQLAEDYGKTQRILATEEESILLWRCEILQYSGWLQTPADVRALARRKKFQSQSPSSTSILKGSLQVGFLPTEISRRELKEI